jgi:heme-degrading monooxygenase HmoA
MIARIWKGKTTTSQANDYMDYFRITGLPDYQSTEGNQGVFVLRRDEKGQADFLILTLWESRQAIQNFAGDDIEKARYYPEDKRYFSELEPNILHYEVVLNTMAPSSE